MQKIYKRTDPRYIARVRRQQAMHRAWEIVTAYAGDLIATLAMVVCFGSIGFIIAMMAR